MKFIVIFSLMLMNLLPVPNAFAEDVIKIGGTGHAIGSMKLLGEAFERSQQNIKIQVVPRIGISDNIKAVSKGILDIGLLSRPLEENEQHWSIATIAYAQTPFVFVANNDVKVSDIKTSEIIKIFRCETNTWPTGKRRRFVLRPDSDPDSAFIKKRFPEIEENFDRTLCHEGRHTSSTEQDNLSVIEKIPGSFGVSTLTSVFSEKRNLNILSFDGISPGLKNHANASYPLYMTFYMMIKKEPSASVRRFIEFICTGDGRKIIEESGNLFISGACK